MANLVLGKNMVLQMSVDSVYYPVFCCKTADLLVNQDALEVTTVASSRDREYISGLRNSQVNCAGITDLDNSAGRVSLLYLIQPGVISATLPLRFVFTDQEGSIVTISFNALITTANVSRAFGSFSQSSVTFQLSGGLTYGSSIDPPAEPVCEVQDPLYLDMAEGETGVSDVLLEAAGVVILHVFRSQIGYVETSGTPGNGEFKFTGGAGNGDIDFDPAVPGNPGGEVVYVLYKIT